MDISTFESILSVLDQKIENINNNIISNKKSLDFEEGCVYTNLSKSYMYKLTSNNLIPYYRPSGKKIYFDRDELDQWKLTNKVKTQNELKALVGGVK